MENKNPMRQIEIEKITLNIGAGKNEEELKRALKLLKKLTNKKPIETVTNKRVPGWNIRPGLAIGAKVTLRGKEAQEMLPRLLEVKENIISQRNFDNQGNLSFGIPEYIDIPGIEYDPELKILGLEVALTLERPGFRIKRRKVKKKKIPQRHKITKEEAIQFMKDKYNIKIKEEVEE